MIKLNCFTYGRILIFCKRTWICIVLEMSWETFIFTSFGHKATFSEIRNSCRLPSNITFYMIFFLIFFAWLRITLSLLLRTGFRVPDGRCKLAWTWYWDMIQSYHLPVFIISHDRESSEMVEIGQFTNYRKVSLMLKIS